MPVKKISNETLAPDQLNPYPNNPRNHTETEIDRLADYIKSLSSEERSGFIDQIIIDENDMILAGHKRALAAIRAKLTAVDCRRVYGLTDQEKRAYIIADNQLTFSSTWDDSLLKFELSELIDDNFDLSKIGFKDEDLKNLGIGENDFDFNPPSENGEVSKKIIITVQFENEDDQQDLFDELKERGYKVKI